MTTIVYTGRHTAIVDAHGHMFINGEPTEVPEEVANALLARGDFAAADNSEENDE